VEDGLVSDPEAEAEAAAAGGLMPGAALYGGGQPVPVAIFTYCHDPKSLTRRLMMLLRHHYTCHPYEFM